MRTSLSLGLSLAFGLMMSCTTTDQLSENDEVEDGINAFDTVDTSSDESSDDFDNLNQEDGSQSLDETDTTMTTPEVIEDTTAEQSVEPMVQTEDEEAVASEPSSTLEDLEKESITSQDAASYKLTDDATSTEDLSFPSIAEETAPAEDPFATSAESPLDLTSSDTALEPIPLAEDSAPVVEEPMLLAEEPAPVVEQPAYVAEQSVEANPDEFDYIIQPNETLGDVSAKLYGTPSRWREIADYNALSDANRIYPGDVIRVKKEVTTEPFFAEYSGTERKSYTVQNGDSLSSIAHSILSSGANWKYLWSFNKQEIEDPNKVYAGQTLHYIEPMYNRSSDYVGKHQ